MSLLMKNKKQLSSLNPRWVCIACGTKWGLWWVNGVYSGPAPHFATYHEGTCDVCNKTNLPVTEPRDYGYLDISSKSKEANTLPPPSLATAKVSSNAVEVNVSRSN